MTIRTDDGMWMGLLNAHTSCARRHAGLVILQFIAVPLGQPQADDPTAITDDQVGVAREDVASPARKAGLQAVAAVMMYATDNSLAVLIRSMIADMDAISIPVLVPNDRWCFAGRMGVLVPVCTSKVQIRWSTFSQGPRGSRSATPAGLGSIDMADPVLLFKDHLMFTAVQVELVQCG